MTFNEWLDKNWEKDNLFPPCLPGNKAVNFLVQYLMGDDYYIVNPLCAEQANCEFVHDILMKYSRKYRKELKKINKLKKQKER